MEYTKSVRGIEHLFICAQSATPHSICLWDPTAGASRWSLRGDELQKASIRTAELLGDHPTHLCVALADKPILHMIPLVGKPENLRNGAIASHQTSIKSVLPPMAGFMQVHPCGDFLFIGADNKLFTWEVHTGQLMSVIEEHIRELSAMRISDCGHFFVTASLGGDVRIFLTVSLITENEPGLGIAGPSSSCASLASYTPHSLSITDLFLSGGHSASLRVLSASEDHSAALYSLATRQVLLRITADQPMSACCMDPAELHIFLASNSGTICAVDIWTKFKDEHVRFGDTKSRTGTIFEQQHSSSVCKLAMSADGARLASGDREGRFCVWDVRNGQCLRSGKMDGPITALSFRLHLPVQLQQQQQEEGDPTNCVKSVPIISALQKQMPTGRRQLRMMVRQPKNERESKAKDEKELQRVFNSLIDRINGGTYAPKRVREEGEGTSNGRISPFRSSLTPSRAGKRIRTCEDAEEMDNGMAIRLNDGNDSSRTAELEERVQKLELELARVTQLNAELYNYAANVVLEEGGSERNGGGGS